MLFICSVTTVSASAMEADEIQNSNGMVDEEGAERRIPQERKTWASNFGGWIDIAAPGIDIKTTGVTYAYE